MPRVALSGEPRRSSPKGREETLSLYFAALTKTHSNTLSLPPRRFPLRQLVASSFPFYIFTCVLLVWSAGETRHFIILLHSCYKDQTLDLLFGYKRLFYRQVTLLTPVASSLPHSLPDVRRPVFNPLTARRRWHRFSFRPLQIRFSSAEQNLKV